MDINNNTEVVGWATFFVPNVNLDIAYKWDLTSGFQSLPFAQPAHNDSRANAINSGGDIVGFSRGFGLTPTGVLWADQSVFLLSDLLVDPTGWFVGEARDINDRGQIVGIGVFNELTTAYLMTPVWSCFAKVESTY